MVRNKLFIVRYIPIVGPMSRFGFIVSTKTAKRATERNRIKRRLRAIVASQHKDSGRAHDVLITALGPTRTASYLELAQGLSHLLTPLHASRRHLSH